MLVELYLSSMPLLNLYRILLNEYRIASLLAEKVGMFMLVIRSLLILLVEINQERSGSFLAMNIR